MPDFVLRNIDDSIAERIKALARERKCSINEVVMGLLRQGLGLGGNDFVQREIQDVARLAGTWDSNEADAFRNALNAFEQVDGRPLFSDSLGPEVDDQKPK